MNREQSNRILDLADLRVAAKIAGDDIAYARYMRQFVDAVLEATDHTETPAMTSPELLS